MASSPLAKGRGVDQEQTLARLTRRLPQSRSSPKLKHLAMTSTSTQRPSDLLRRLGRTHIYMLHCSHQTTFKVGSHRRSSYLVDGFTKRTTQESCKRMQEIVVLAIGPRHGAREEQAGSRLVSAHAIQADPLWFQGESRVLLVLKLSQPTKISKLPSDQRAVHTTNCRGYTLHLTLVGCR